MSEKPILFSTEMVKAILDGKKTQTRRAVTVHWHKGKRVLPYEPYYVESDGKLLFADEYGEYHPMEQLSPYGQSGDVFRVRETWAKDANGNYVYRTDYGTTEDDSFPPSMFKWKPSIHMPRAAARLFLKVKNIRVERLQDITEEDAQKEMSFDSMYDLCAGFTGKYKIAFEILWDSIYSAKGYGWDENPFVWVVEFELL